MGTQKTNIAPRFVVDGYIRFCGRKFTHPAFSDLDYKTVWVAFDHYTDESIDILNDDQEVIAVLENRQVAA